MDVKLDWTISDDVETLVDSIIDCRKQLIKDCVFKHGMRSRVLDCDAYASGKIIELLRLSTRWVECLDDLEEDLTVPTWRRQKKHTELVADFSSFRLHVSPVMGSDIRVVMSFDVGDAAMQTWFGTVTSVTQ